MKLILDKWQEEILSHEGNIALRSGRQVGKSTCISIKAAEYALKNPKKVVLIISSVERQAYFLFEKTLGYLIDNYKTEIRQGKDRPTKSQLRLRNGSKILSLPTGIDGHGIRGLTIDLLIADEAAFIPYMVWQAVTPMLATTKGNLILLSTPFGKGTKDEPNYFYERYNDPAFRTWHISSEDCPRVDKAFLAREEQRMTNMQYAQEYLGEFVDELMQFFPTHLIERAMIYEHRNPKTKDRFLGVDVARMGGDETAFASVEQHMGVMYMFSLDVYTQTYITDTIRMIKYLDEKFKYRRIYIDTGGLGVGVYDSLREDEQTKRKVREINNAKRLTDYETSKAIPKITFEERKAPLMKEAIYSNLLKLLETDKIKLLQSPELLLSLKSIQYEYTEDGRIRIFGNYSHIAEALVRAAWGIKDKSLNIWVA